METATHIIGDPIDSYSDLLAYVREDAEVHLQIEHGENDELCPTKLYARGQALYDDHKLWRLMKAAPTLLGYCQGLLEDAGQMADDRNAGQTWDWQLTANNLKHVIAEATGKAA